MLLCATTAESALYHPGSDNVFVLQLLVSADLLVTSISVTNNEAKMKLKTLKFPAFYSLILMTLMRTLNLHIDIELTCSTNAPVLFS